MPGTSRRSAPADATGIQIVIKIIDVREGGRGRNLTADDRKRLNINYSLTPLILNNSGLEG